MKARFAFVTATLLMSVTACAPWSAVKPVDWAPSGAVENVGRCRLAAASSYVMVLKNLDRAEFDFQNPDIAVVDFQSGTGECGDMTADDVKALRERGDDPRGDRIVLAYLDIGRAEHYRIVWLPDGPDGKCVQSVMTRVDPAVEDDGEITFVNPGWKATLAGGPGSYVDRIVGLGFDGVVLGGMSVVRNEAGEVWPEHAVAMADLVTSVVQAARQSKPDFLVVVSDPWALESVEGVRDLFSGVLETGVIMDGGYFRPAESLTPVLERFNAFRAMGLPVFSVEFIDDAIQQTLYQNLCAKMGYLCFITVPDLNAPGLAVNAGNRGECR